MQSFTYLAIAAAALLQGAVAVPAVTTSTPTSLPGHYVCTSITTVTTTRSPPGVCHYACPNLTSTCKLGQPSEAPFSTVTTTPLPGCTVSEIVEKVCECPTCIAAPTPTPQV